MDAETLKNFFPSFSVRSISVIIVGPEGCGKTEMLQWLKDNGYDEQYSLFDEQAPTNRPFVMTCQIPALKSNIYNLLNARPGVIVLLENPHDE